MATAKARRGTNRGNRLLWIGTGLVILLGLWAAFGSAALGYAHAGTAYGARVACSCRFVAGRSLDDCAKDKLAGMALVRFSEDALAKSVKATIPLVAAS